MGWARGSSLFSSIIIEAKKAIPDVKIRKEFYRKCIAAFEDHDCDTLNECFEDNPVFEAAYWELHPEEWAEEQAERLADEEEQ